MLGRSSSLCARTPRGSAATPEREHGDRNPHSSRYPSHWRRLPDATEPGTARGGARRTLANQWKRNGSGEGGARAGQRGTGKSAEGGGPEAAAARR